MPSQPPQGVIEPLQCPRSRVAGLVRQPYRLGEGWRRPAGSAGGGGASRANRGALVGPVAGPPCMRCANRFAAGSRPSRPAGGRSAAGRRRAAATRRTWAGQPCADILDTRSSWPGGMAMEHCAEPSVGVSVALKKESAICPAAGLQPQPPGRARDSRASCWAPWDRDRLIRRLHCGASKRGGACCAVQMCAFAAALRAPPRHDSAPQIAASKSMRHLCGEWSHCRPPPPAAAPLLTLSLVPMTDRPGDRQPHSAAPRKLCVSVYRGSTASPQLRTPIQPSRLCRHRLQTAPRAASGRTRWAPASGGAPPPRQTWRRSLHPASPPRPPRSFSCGLAGPCPAQHSRRPPAEQPEPGGSTESKPGAARNRSWEGVQPGVLPCPCHAAAGGHRQ